MELGIQNKTKTAIAAFTLYNWIRGSDEAAAAPPTTRTVPSTTAKTSGKVGARKTGRALVANSLDPTLRFELLKTSERGFRQMVCADCRRGTMENDALNAGLKASTARQRRDRGAMLLAVLFMMAVMVIVALSVAPSFVLQAKRDREEEMIHRGTEYARAIKKYYKRFGQYPANLEQLDNTNQIRFLRRRFKDPLTKDGEWKLVHYGDVASFIGANAPVAPGALGSQSGPAPGVPIGSYLGAGASGDQSTNATAVGALSSPQQQSGSPGNQAQAVAQPGGQASPDASGAAGAQGQSSPLPGGGAGGTQDQNLTGQPGSNNTIFGNTGVGGQTFGGGAIVGVASKSKDATIRIFTKKKT